MCAFFCPLLMPNLQASTTFLLHFCKANLSLYIYTAWRSSSSVVNSISEFTTLQWQENMLGHKTGNSVWNMTSKMLQDSPSTLKKFPDDSEMKSLDERIKTRAARQSNMMLLVNNLPNKLTWWYSKQRTCNGSNIQMSSKASSKSMRLFRDQTFLVDCTQLCCARQYSPPTVAFRLKIGSDSLTAMANNTMCAEANSLLLQLSL